MTSENESTPWFFMSCTTRVLSIRIWPGFVSIIVSIGITCSSIAADADIPEEVRRELRVRVEPVAFLPVTDAVEVQRLDPALVVRRDLPADPRPARLMQMIAERLPFPGCAVAEGAAEFRDGIVGI